MGQSAQRRAVRERGAGGCGDSSVKVGIVFKRILGYGVIAVVSFAAGFYKGRAKAQDLELPVWQDILMAYILPLACISAGIIGESRGIADPGKNLMTGMKGAVAGGLVGLVANHLGQLAGQATSA